MIVVTLGELKSINVCALARILSDLESPQVIVVGSRTVWDFQLLDHQSKYPSNAGFVNRFHYLNFTELASGKLSLQEFSHQKFLFCDVTESCGLLGKSYENLLCSVESRGKIAFESLRTLSFFMNEAEKAGEKFAVLTCPVDKYVLSKVGYSFGGQTEFFESLFEGKGIMILAGPKLRVGLATNHVALKDVSSSIDQNILFAKGRALRESLQSIFGIANPRIVVCGLNPHCSDMGLFGNEEELVVRPAIDKLNTEVGGADFTLRPADTAFYDAYQGKFDAVLAMYHDQGLAPLKTVHFDSAVNITGGLKHLRVSPDHGPAEDLMGTDDFSSVSFENALTMCRDYVSR